MKAIRFDETMGATRAVLSDTRGCAFEAEFYTTLRQIHNMMEQGIISEASWGAINRKSAARRAVSCIKTRN